MKFIFRYFLTYNLKKKFYTSDNNCSSIIVRINETKKKSGTETRILPNMTGRFNLTGKKVISIQSCHGDSIINSTHPVEVFCSDNGNRTSCVDVKCRNRCNPKNRSKFKRLMSANIELL